MNHRIRLGPFAIFLTVMVMVMTMLALLTISTSNADLVMAGRFASITQTRYALETDAERFLSEASDPAAAGRLAEKPEVNATAGGYRFEKESNGYKLVIEISIPDSSGSYELRSRSISRIWRSDDPTEDIWKGN